MAIPIYDPTVLPCLVLPMTNTQEVTKRYMGKNRTREQYKSIVVSTAPHGDVQQSLLYDFWNIECAGGTLPFETSIPLFGKDTPRLVVRFVGNLTSSKTNDGLWITRFKLVVYREQLSIPTAPGNLTATNDEYNQITFRWEPSEGFPTPTYTLYREGVPVGTTENDYYIYLIPGLDTANYYVVASNQEGSSQSSTVSGTSLQALEAPNAPQQFQASDDQLEQITFTWFNSTVGEPQPTYDIYETGGESDTLIASNVITPHTQPIQGNTTHDYYVQAVNSSGTADSNLDSGTSIETPSGAQEFLADDTFIVPAHVTSINVCMIGGGGSGASAYLANFIGGGHGGVAVNQTLAVTPGQVIPITIGAGGAAVLGSTSSVNNHGNAGGDTIFGALTATGGAGGVYSGLDDVTYKGNGASRTTCYATTTDGLLDGTGDVAYGGHAGFGKGGNADRAVTVDTNAEAGGYGAGGGGLLVVNFGRSGYSGAGGAGLVKVSWG